MGTALQCVGVGPPGWAPSTSARGTGDGAVLSAGRAVSPAAAGNLLDTPGVAACATAADMEAAGFGAGPDGQVRAKGEAVASWPGV